jgi:uncharacterized damage-inducible protein DinB
VKTSFISARSLGVLALAAIVVLPAAANAQARAKATPKTSANSRAANGLQKDLIKDVDDVEKKYQSLAGAMTGKYSWRPAEKVRSVSEVFMHISGENYALPIAIGFKPPSDFAGATLNEAFGTASAMEKVTDETEVNSAIEKSFAHVKQAITSIPDSELDKEITVFGDKMTKRAFLILTVTHMHEHLGQLIAYARMNGVTPPWSTGSGG